MLGLPSKTAGGTPRNGGQPPALCWPASLAKMPTRSPLGLDRRPVLLTAARLGRVTPTRLVSSGYSTDCQHSLVLLNDEQDSSLDGRREPAGPKISISNSKRQPPPSDGEVPEPGPG